jgi:hypothetical protein
MVKLDDDLVEEIRLSSLRVLRRLRREYEERMCYEQGLIDVYREWIEYFERAIKRCEIVKQKSLFAIDQITIEIKVRNEPL